MTASTDPNAQPQLSPGRTVYSPDAGDTVQCPECSKFNDTDAIHCDQCGAELPDEAFASSAHLAKPAGPTPDQAFRARIPSRHA